MMLGALLYFASLPHVLAINRSLMVARDYSNRGEMPLHPIPSEPDESVKPVYLEAVEIIRSHSQADDFVITDDQLVAFHAGRRVPPEMAALSSRAVAIGAYSNDRLVDATLRTRAPVIMSMESRLRRFRKYMEWVEENYSYLGQLSDGRARAFVRR
jgi:hypothetical protein